MKRMKYAILSFLLALAVFVPIHIHANATISMPGSAYVGDTITVRISVPSNSKSWAYSVSGAVSAEPMGFEGDSTTNTYTFKASKEGTYTVNVYGQYSDGTNDYQINTSASVKVVKKASSNSQSNSNSSNSSSSSSSSSGSSSSSSSSKPTTTTPAQEPEDDPRSKNYNLSSLSVDQGTLSPKFDADVTSYKVSLPKDVKEITVSAKAEDSKASVSGTGKKELKAGDNKIEVTCTSEYGTKQVYTINVYVDEEPLVYFDYNDSSLGVVRNTQDVEVPDGFKESKVKVDDQEIIAWTNEKLNRTIVYLIDEEDNKGFYLYEDGEVISSFKEIEIAGRTMYQVDIPKDKQTITNMTFGTVTIKDLELQGWSFNNEKLNHFVVVYVMNEKGEIQYYQYDSTEETLQLFNGLSVDNQDLEQAKTLQYVGFGVGAAAVIALISLGAWVIVKQKKQ